MSASPELRSASHTGVPGHEAPARSGPHQRRPRPARRWWRDALFLTVWASLLVVVALWVAGGGIQELTNSPAGALTSAGRILGLVASDLLLIQVLMMARIPWAESVFGQDTLARWHRLLGFTSFNLLIAHVVAIVVGYSLTSRQNFLAQTWDLTWNYPGMLLAVAGTACLVMVVVTSIRLARRRLRYESWHLLHLYAYVGVGLALPHQLWTGADFLTNTWAAVYWWTLWGLAATSIVIWRILLPCWRSLWHRLVVHEVVQQGPGVVSVVVRGRRLHRMPVRAGQFLSWRFLDGRAGWSRAHPYSLSAAPDGENLRITVKALGDDSARLAQLKPGTHVLVEGPYGRLTEDVRQRRKVTWVAAGIGITPIRALMEDLDVDPGGAVLLLRATHESDILLTDEILGIAAAKGIRVVHILGPRIRERASWLPEGARHLTDTEALVHLVPDIADHDVYVCGPTGWMDAVADAVRGAGVPAAQLHEERFSW